jgi:hypothetical protein
MSRMIKIAAVLLIVGGLLVGPSSVLLMTPTDDTVISVVSEPRSGFLRALFNFFYGWYEPIEVD